MKNFFRTIILGYLKFFAKLQLRKYCPDLIAITGSAGKTSLTNACYAILSSRFTTNYTVKANSESGIPLHILGLQMQDYSFFDWLRVMILAPYQVLTYNKRFEKYILELGVDKPGDMAYLLTIVQPRVGVILNVSSVHAQNFDVFEDPVSAIAFEKMELVKSLSPDNGLAIVNYDDPRIFPLIDKIKTKVIFFSLKPQPENVQNSNFSWLFADNIISMDKGFSMTVHWQGQKYSLALDNLALGKHFAYTLLAAIAVGISNGISINQSIEALKNFKLPKGRGSIIPGIKDTVLIDSSYNASKQAVLAMLDVLADFPQKRKIAVLGDMRELGSLAEDEHKALAKKVIEVVDEIVTVGPQMRDFFVPETQALGFDQTKVHYFLSPYEAAKFLKEKVIQGGEAILIKGSQNTIFLEEVVKELMKYPEMAEDLLCRQEPMWEKKRKQLIKQS